MLEPNGTYSLRTVQPLCGGVLVVVGRGLPHQWHAKHMLYMHFNIRGLRASTSFSYQSVPGSSLSWSNSAQVHSVVKDTNFCLQGLQNSLDPDTHHGEELLDIYKLHLRRSHQAAHPASASSICCCCLILVGRFTYAVCYKIMQFR